MKIELILTELRLFKISHFSIFFLHCMVSPSTTLLSNFVNMLEA